MLVAAGAIGLERNAVRLRVDAAIRQFLVEVSESWSASSTRMIFSSGFANGDDEPKGAARTEKTMRERNGPSSTRQTVR